MKNLSTLIKLSTLLIIGCGTVSAAVGVTEAQMKNNDIVENDEFVHAGNIKIKNGERFYFEISDYWARDNATMRVKFGNNDQLDQTKSYACIKGNKKNLWYVDAPSFGEWDCLQLLRFNPEGNTQWNWARQMAYNGMTYFKCAGLNWNDDVPFDWFNVRTSDFFKDSVASNKENNNDIVDIYLNKHNHYYDLRYLLTLNIKNNGKEFNYEPLDYPVIKDSYNNDLYLTHFAVEKADILNGEAQIVFNEHIDLDQKNDLFVYDSNTEGRVVYNLDNANKIWYLNQNDNNPLTIGFGSLESGQKITKEITESIFAGIDSCSEDKITGYPSINRLKEVWNFENSLDVLASASVYDYEKTIDNKPFGNMSWTCDKKYEFLKIQNTKLGSPTLVNNVLSKENMPFIITTVALLGLSTIGIFGFIFLNKKRKPLFK